MKILVSADTSCLVNKEVLNKNGISVFPLNVIIDGKEYLDGVTIDQDFLRDEMRANKNIKTSTPPMGEVVEYFEKLFAQGYEKIIHFTISSKLSSMYQLFKNVAESYFEGKVIVMDAYAVSSVMLAQVILTNEEVKKGTPIEEIINKVEDIKNNNCIYCIPESLTFLKNGGRISSFSALLGNTLGLKPVIKLKDGELVKDSMTRNIKKEIHTKLAELTEQFPVSEYDYTLLTFDVNENTTQLLRDYYAEILDGNPLIEGIIPINVCAHCGPGTIGIVVSKKLNGVSLHNYL